MFCPKCGTTVEEAAQFCGKCGAEVRSAVGAAATSETRKQSSKVVGWLIVLLGVVTMFVPSRVVPLDVLKVLAFIISWVGFSVVLSGSSTIMRIGSGLVGAAVVVFPLVYLRDTVRDSSGATDTAVAANEVSLDSLLSDYKANEVAADQKYKGQTIRTSGVLKEVKKDIADNPFVLVGTNTDPLVIPELQCSLSRSAVQEAARLTRGAPVTVQGSVRGLLLNVQLADCTFVAPSVVRSEQNSEAATNGSAQTPAQVFTVNHVITFSDGTSSDRTVLEPVAKEDAQFAALIGGDFTIAREDLNEDGVKEILIVGGRDFCGSGGCLTEVFEKQGDSCVAVFSQNLAGSLAVTNEKVGKFHAIAATDDKGKILTGEKDGTPMNGKQMVYPVGN